MCFSSSFCFSAMASNTAHVPLFSNLIRQQSLCGKASSRTYFLWTCPPTFQETPSYTCTMGPRPTPEQLVLTLVASWGHNALWTPEKNWILDFKKEERWRYSSFTCIYRAIWSRGGGGQRNGLQPQQCILLLSKVNNGWWVGKKIRNLTHPADAEQHLVRYVPFAMSSVCFFYQIRNKISCEEALSIFH